MTATVTVNGQQATITFEYTGALSNMQALALTAAEYLFDHGYGDHGTDDQPRVFSDLSNAERLDMLDQHVRRVLMDAARAHLVASAIDAARDQAESDESINI